MSDPASDDSLAGLLADNDVDSLYVLPLSIVPFQTDTLRNARLMKNQRMESIAQIYAERGIGSAQMDVTALPQHLHWRNEQRADYDLLRTLSSLPSFDVYTVRRSLRALGANVDGLNLTDEKRRQLDAKMQRFTMPLIRAVYGESARDVQRFEDVIVILRDPDVKKALSRLKMIAEKLQIAVEEIPRFIEDYADSFLLLSYYNQCLDRVTPLIERFTAAVSSLKSALLVRREPKLGNEIGRQEKSLSGLVRFLRRMFEEFDAMSRDLWANLSAETFGRMRACIDNAQVQIASVLCGLTVKLGAWVSQFPVPKLAVAGSMIEFLMSEMRPGTNELVAAARGATA